MQTLRALGCPHLRRSPNGASSGQWRSPKMPLSRFGIGLAAPADLACCASKRSGGPRGATLRAGVCAATGTACPPHLPAACAPGLSGDLSRGDQRLTSSCSFGAPLNPWPDVALHVVHRRKNASDLDAEGGCVRAFDLKPIVSGMSGRKVSEFGTVRPRVQIPGPRPTN